MKKIVLMTVLGLLFQSIPAKTMASKGPVPGSGGAVALGLIALFGENSSAAKPTNTEFAQLNSFPATKSLINQAASGALNTAEIIKQQ